MEVVFDKVSDKQFWTDRERVKLLIELYERNECLWNATSKDYKNAPKKKVAKGDISAEFSGRGQRVQLPRASTCKGAPTQVVEHLENIIHLAHTFIFIFHIFHIWCFFIL